MHSNKQVRSTCQEKNAIPYNGNARVITPQKQITGMINFGVNE